MPLNSASVGSVNRPQESVPHTPARPCADSAPTGSSSTFSIARTPSTTMTPATNPMIVAAQGLTYPDGAVIATSAAIAPLHAMPMSGFRVLSQIVVSAPITPQAAAMLVTRTMSAKRMSPFCPVELSALSVEPGLNPNQPNQRMKVARPTNGMLWPGITLGFPSGPYLPRRAPSSSSTANPPVAPVRWTTVEPAKSWEPRLAASQP